MNEMKVYRVLQTHAANINRLVASLYNGGITVSDAVEETEKEIKHTTDKINKIKSGTGAA